MKGKLAGIVAVVGGFILIVWLTLRGAKPTQVIAPDGQASGLPPYQARNVAYNIGTPVAAPSPNLINYPPPPFPTPGYQSFNYSPQSIYKLTPEAAATTPAKTASKDSGCCGGCGGCGCADGNCATYGDGSGQKTCLASNAAQQAGNISANYVYAAASNLATSQAAVPGFMTGVMSNLISGLPSAF